MSDHIAIQRTLMTYVVAIDSRALDLFGQCFAEGEVIHMGKKSYSWREWAASVGKSLERLDATHHFLSPSLIDLNGDRASSRTYYTAQHTRNDLGDRPNLTIGGWYDDELERRGDRWLIVRRMGATVWAEGNPDVLGGVFPVGATRRGSRHAAPAWLAER